MKIEGSGLGFFSRLLLGILLALTAGVANAELLGHWSFDDGSGAVAADNVNANNAFIVHTSNITWTADGRIGGSVTYNGYQNPGDAFKIGSIPQMSEATALTVSVWFKAASGTIPGQSYKGLVLTRDLTPNPAEGYNFQNWGLAWADTYCESRIGSGLRTNDPILQRDEWFHLVMTWNAASQQRITYLNAVPHTEDYLLFNYSNIVDSGEWWIGADLGTIGRTFKGELDDVTMWDQALDEFEIANVYWGGLNGTAAPDVDLNGVLVPTITTQPQNATRILGATDTTPEFSITASEMPPRGYTWFVNGVENLDENGPVFSDQDIPIRTPREYYCVLTGSDGVTTVTSDTVTVTELLPAINEGSQTIETGANAQLTINMPANQPYSYQWYKNGSPMAGIITRGLSITDAQVSDNGSYKVEVTWNGTTLMSAPVDLTVETAPQPGLIGHWSFDNADGDTAVDSINNNNAIIGNALNATWSNDGIAGGCVALNGGIEVGDAFEIASIPQMAGATALTISMWFNPHGEPQPGQSTYKGLVMSRSVTTDLNTAGNDNWGLAWEQMSFCENRHGQLGGGQDSPVGKAANTDAWYHVAMTWDAAANLRYLYIDGIQYRGNSPVANGTSNIIDSGSWSIGLDPSLAARTLKGSIDDVTMWTESLSELAINNIYFGGRTGTAAPNVDLDAMIFPRFITQPQNATRILGDVAAAVSFTVEAVGVDEYYWYYDNKDGFGFQEDWFNAGSTLIDGGYDIIDVNDYYCVLEDAGQSVRVTSDVVTVEEYLPPIMEGSQSVEPGSLATITISMPANNQTFDYQWYKDDIEIAGQASSQLVFNAASAADEGSYKVDVTWNGITMTSETVQLNVATGFQSGLLAHWPMDETNGIVATETVFGNDALWMASDGAGLTWTTGICGGAAQLPGEGDSTRLFTAPDNYQNLAATTWSLWVYCDEPTLTSYRGIMGSRNENMMNQWGFNLHHAYQAIDFRLAGSSFNTPDSYMSDQWVHLAFTWDKASGDVKTYINGELTASLPGAGKDYERTSSGTLYFGSDPAVLAARLLRGKLDDIAIWGRALTDIEINALYQNGTYGVSVKDATEMDPPHIVTQPTDILRAEGSSFNVVAAGSEPFYYQWRRDGVDIAGATSSSLEVVELPQLGAYDCVVSNPGGNVVSTAAALREVMQKPKNFRTPPLSPSEVGLYWQAVQGAQSYRIERRIGTDAPWQTLFELSADITDQLDYRLTTGVTYTYRLVALSAEGQSPYSDLSYATTGGTNLKPTEPVMALTIVGRTAVDEETETVYYCLAEFEYDFTRDVTPWTTWMDDSDYATISSNGVLTTQEITADVPCTLDAVFDGVTANLDITVINAYGDSSPMILSPRENSRTATNRPTFIWTPHEGAEWYRVTVFPYGQNVPAVDQWIKGDTILELDETLANGEYTCWLMAWSPGNTNHSTDPRRFSIGVPSVPQPVSPVDIDLRPSDMVQFIWKKSEAETNDTQNTWYQLWINDQAATRINSNEIDSGWFSEDQMASNGNELATDIHSTAFMVPGKFHWWARAVDIIGSSTWTEAAGFNIGHQIEPGQLGISAEDAETITATELSFKWQPVSWATHYDIVIVFNANDLSRGGYINQINAIESTNLLLGNQPESGAYSWWVRPTNPAEGWIGGWGINASFKVD